MINKLINFLSLDLISIILTIISFLLVVGVITMVERKFIGLAQLRASVGKQSPKGVYTFFKDFLKMSFKYKNLSNRNIFNFFKSHFKPLFLLLVYFFLNMGIFTFSLNADYKTSKSLKIELLNLFLIECIVILNKLALINYLCGVKISKQLASKFKLLYIILEGAFFYTLSVISFLVDSFGLIGWRRVLEEHFSEKFILGLLYFLLLFLVIKASRTPFDFFESESETGGGLSGKAMGMPFVVMALYEYGQIVSYILLLIKILITFYKGFVLNLFIEFILLILFGIFLWILLIIRAVLIRYRYRVVKTGIPILELYILFYIMMVLIYL